MLSGFQLQALPPAGPAEPDAAVPLIAMNNLLHGSRLRYAPRKLPQAWRHSARVAVVLVPNAVDVSTKLPVFNVPADKTATWTMPDDIGAVAFLFGPNGLNATKTRSLLAAHPELISQFISYATRASRVEALVALLYQYEQSPPGSMDLKTMLKNYAAEYGVSVPKTNTALSPEQEASVMLTSLSPPTAQNGPSPHAEITAGSTTTAASLATLYFAPEMAIATDTVPLFKALHTKLFPGTEFQGAFAQPMGKGMALCLANVAPPAGKRPVYIWVVDLPGGAKPSPRIVGGSAGGGAGANTATVPEGGTAKLAVTAASVGQLHAMLRLRQWRLAPVADPAQPVQVPAAVSVGELHDTVALDLSHTRVPPGNYHLAAEWDWQPVPVAGTVRVRAIPDLRKARLAPGAEDKLVSGGGEVTVALTGADFSFVRKIELVPPGDPAPAPAVVEDVPFSRTAASGGASGGLQVKLDLAHLAPGQYELRLIQAEGDPNATAQSTHGSSQGAAPEGARVAITIHPPDPSLSGLPLKANEDAPGETVTLRGKHLERITRLVTPGATWQLYPVTESVAAAGDGEASGLTERGAAITLQSQAQAGQLLPMSVYVEGLSEPLSLPDAVRVLGPRPRIRDVSESAGAGGSVELFPGELAQDAITNVSFGLDHGGADPTVQLRCQQSGIGGSTVTLHPGESNSSQELDASGGGLYYLATTPGKIGPPGCRLEMIASDANGASQPFDLGSVVRLPEIKKFTLSNQSAGPGRYAGELQGLNLQLIAKTGWTPKLGVPVTSIPQRSAGKPLQSLAIVMPWPPPEPHAPIYIWLRGEPNGRKTSITP